MSLLANVGKNSSLFFLGRSVSAFATVAAIPVYSRLIEPQQYGLYALVNGVLLSIIVLSGCGLSSSITRFYHESDPGEITRNAILAQVVIGAGAVLVLLLLFPVLLLYGLSEYYQIVATAIPLVLLENLVVIQISFYRIRQEAVQYAIVSIVQRWIGIGFTIVLLYLDVGVSSLFIGLAIADVLLIIYFFFNEWKQNIRLSADVVRMKYLLLFGLPVAFDSLIFSVFQLSDRYILGLYHSLSDVGVYSFVYDIALKAQFLIVLPMTQVVEPMFWIEIKKNGIEQAKKLVSQSTQYFIVFIGFLSGFIFLYSAEITRILASERYLSHVLLLPVLVFALLLYGVFYVIRIGIFYAMKTKHLLLVTGSVAAAKIVISFLIIPHHGILAAAFSTLIGYLVLTIVAYWNSSRFLKIRYSFFRNTVGVAALLLSAYGILLVLPEGVLLNGIFKGVLYLIISLVIVTALFKEIQNILVKKFSLEFRTGSQ